MNIEVNRIRKIALAITGLVLSAGGALSQVPPKDKFTVQIIKVTRVAEGCSVLAESPTVRFTVSSDAPSPCGMLHAGEAYKAVRAMIQNNPKDETKDSAILVIYNNVENSRRDNAVFAIQSEEVIAR